MLWRFLYTEEIANACCVTTSQLRHALAGAAGVPDWRHGSDYCAALLCVPAHWLALADRPDVHCRDIAANPAWLAGGRVRRSLGSPLDDDCGGSRASRCLAAAAGGFSRRSVADLCRRWHSIGDLALLRPRAERDHAHAGR